MPLRSPEGSPSFRPRTILFLDHTAKLGGGEIALLRLLPHLDRARFRPVVLLCTEGPLVECLRAEGIETHVLPLTAEVAETRKHRLNRRAVLQIGLIAQALSYALRLARFCREQRAELLYTNSLKADILGGLAGRLAGIPVVWHVRDRIADDYLPGFAARAFRLLCRFLPRYVVTNSNATLQTLSLPAHRIAPIEGALTGARASVIYDGIDAERPPAAERSDAAPKVGLVGRLSPWKGQHIFIEAAALVRQRFPACRFQIVGAALFGEETYAEQLHRQATALGLDDCLEFTGFRRDVDTLIADMTLLVHASTTGEPFGQVVLEGMAAGKPVVATRGGAIPEIVLEGTTGLMVPMGSAAEMANAICALLADPARAQKMGQAGYERARRRFAITQTARQVEHCLNALLDKTR